MAFCSQKGEIRIVSSGHFWHMLTAWRFYNSHIFHWGNSLSGTLSFCPIACNLNFFIHFLLLRLPFLGIIPCVMTSVANLVLSDPWTATTINACRWLGDLSGLCSRRCLVPVLLWSILNSYHLVYVCIIKKSWSIAFFIFKSKLVDFS